MNDNGARVLRPSEITPVARGGGVTSILLVTRATGSTSFINGITIFPPKTAVPLHKHNCQESVLLLEGAGVAHIDGKTFAVTRGVTTLIPTGMHHFFENTSATEVMKIFWTYASLDANRTIIETGETRMIVDEHPTPSK